MNYHKTKDLYTLTYSNDICSCNMFNICYNGLRLVPSKSALDEMIHLGLALEDCQEILDNDIPAPRKRAKNTEEKWLHKGNKTWNIVIVKEVNLSCNEEIQLITHVGCLTRKK